MAGGFYPQDAEAGVLVEIRYTLDEAGDPL
jgi:hypothetical protein